MLANGEYQPNAESAQGDITPCGSTAKGFTAIDPQDLAGKRKPAQP